MVFGVWTPLNGNQFSLLDALVVSLIAIAVVFAVLIVIVLACGGFQKGIEVVDAKANINPRPENNILKEDEDAVAAVLVATMDFNKETGQNARLVSIEKIDEE